MKECNRVYTKIYRVALLLALSIQFSCSAANDSTLTKSLQKNTKPNVIVIITDDQGYGDLSLHGNPVIQTPALDKLAQDGVRLDDFHVDPTCSPTRAALMTGRYATKAGVWLTYASRNHLYRDETTMANVFKNNGYRTGIFGKWHLGDNYPFRPQDRGFEHSYIHSGGVVGEAPDYWENDYFDDVYLKNGKPEQAKGYSGDQWFNEAIRYIDDGADKPFFIYLATNTPHGPFNIMPEHAQQYIDKGEPETRARFYGMIQNVDNNVSKLRKHLDEKGLAENTLILYLTDNGTTSGVSNTAKGYLKSGYNAGMRGKKTSAYEGGHRAAGFMYWPNGKLTGGKVVNQLTAHIDILPTFINLLHLKAPSKVQFDGVSLAAVLQDTAVQIPPRDVVVHNQARFGKPAMEGELKYGKDFVVMRDKWRLVGKELYDVRSDPGQRIDLAAQKPDQVASMRASYENWWKDVSSDQRHAPIVINHKFQNVAKLTGQAWYGNGVPYDQQHIRGAMKATGYWLIDVEVAGDYDFEISRWPKESGLQLNQKPPAKAENPGLDPNFGLYQIPDTAIDVKKISFSLNDLEQYTQTTGSEQSVTFRKNLTKGRHKISSALINSDGERFGAYFVYISLSK